MAIFKRLRKYRKMDTKEAEKNIANETEKGDFASMWIAAMFTIWLPCLLALLAFGGLILLIFR